MHAQSIFFAQHYILYAPLASSALVQPSDRFEIANVVLQGGDTNDNNSIVTYDNDDEDDMTVWIDRTTVRLQHIKEKE